MLIPNLAFGVFLIKGIYTFIKTGETILRLNTFGNALSDMTSILGSCLFRGATGCGKLATGSGNGVTNSGIYGDDGDLISSQGHHAPGGGRVQGGSTRGLRNGGGSNWSGAQSPALSNISGRFSGSDNRSNAMAAAHQQAALAGLGMGVGGFNLGWGSPGLGVMPNGLNLVQLAQLNGMNGMNPFGINMKRLGMANLSAMGI